MTTNCEQRLTGKHCWAEEDPHRCSLCCSCNAKFQAGHLPPQPVEGWEEEFDALFSIIQVGHRNSARGAGHSSKVYYENHFDSKKALKSFITNLLSRVKEQETALLSRIKEEEIALLSRTKEEAVAGLVLS